MSSNARFTEAFLIALFSLLNHGGGGLERDPSTTRGHSGGTPASQSVSNASQMTVAHVARP